MIQGHAALLAYWNGEVVAKAGRRDYPDALDYVGVGMAGADRMARGERRSSSRRAAARTPN